MNKILLSLVMLGLGWGSSAAEDESMRDLSWVGQDVSSQFAAFHRFTVEPSPDDKTLVAAYCEYQPAWWGHLRVFKHAGGKAEWAAEFPEDYIEQRGHYVLSFRWVKLESTRNQVLEVFESSHMGNGSMFLLELEERKFRVLLQATARGRYWTTDPDVGIPPNGEARFREEHLDVGHQKAQGGKPETVSLKGTVSIIDASEKEIAVTPYLAEYRWDKETRTFTEDVKKQK